MPNMILSMILFSRIEAATSQSWFLRFFVIYNGKKDKHFIVGYTDGILSSVMFAWKIAFYICE